MKLLTNLLLLLCLVALSRALPRPTRETEEELPQTENIKPQPDLLSKDDIKDEKSIKPSAGEAKNPKDFNYASLQSQIIATNILKDNIRNGDNEVFSPLGISSILAILAEGSQGDTYKEFQTALGYPDNKILLRESFRNVLQSYKQSDYDNAPSFKTWFYIYKNNTAKDEFKDIIKNYYTAEVKEIEEIDFDWDKPKTAVEDTKVSMTEANNESGIDDTQNAISKDEKSVENLKASTLEIAPSVVANPQHASNDDAAGLNSKNNSKDIIGFEDLKKSDFFDEKSEHETEPKFIPSEVLSTETDMNKNNELQEKNNDGVSNVIGEIIEVQKEASKFDAVVDDKQYVEVPVIRAEIAKEMEEKRKREEKEASLMTATKKKSEILKEEQKPVRKDYESSLMNAILDEMKAENLALTDFVKENTEVSQDQAASAAVEEIKENLIKEVVLLEEPNKEIKLPIEVPFENIDSNQIRRVDLVDINDEENETISQDEKIDNLRKNTGKNDKSGTNTVIFVESKEPEKITLSIKKFDDENGEIMEAVETSFNKRRIEPRTLIGKEDIASALSANSISGRENPAKTKMLLFNGLYYRGNWAHPFMELRCERMESFHTTEGKTIPIKMMKTRGSFRMAKLESLESDALELPYENEQYSFIVIVPKQIDGLAKLIEKLQPVDLQMLQTRLTNTLTTINLPKFEIEQTTRSENTMKRLGINKIFSAYTSNMADMSDEPGLHVEEIVQHVNLRVDEGATSENAISASNSFGRAADADSEQNVATDEDDDEKHFDVNRPFLYFVMDRTNNFIIAAGKLTQPQIREEFGFES